jgi:carbamoyltransferase
MYILGIHDRHNATASLLKDGQIIAAASEERFTRLKNQSGFPFLAVKYCLESAMIKGKDVNLTVFANNSPFSLAASIISARVLQNKAPSQNVKLAKALYYHLHSLILSAEYRLLQTKPASIIRNNPAYKFLFRFFEKKGYQAIGQITGLNIRKMREIDHHLAHACSAIYASPFPALKKKTLIFTCDGSGDGLSATISLYTNGKIKNLSLTPAINSLGNFYAYITAFLGMKPLEHEYKVMGLAPYSPDFGKNLAYQILKPLIWLDKKTLTFRTKFSSELFGLYFQKTLPQIRFDFVASASQQITEELLTAWVKEAIKKYRIRSIACSGGVFMNVKVNQKIAELPEVKDSFFMPSGGDESNALGAAYWGYRYVAKKIPRPLTNLYLGPSYSQTEIKNAFKQNKIHGRIKINLDIEKTIASLLAKGEIVARLNGRMEWGARALVNPGRCQPAGGNGNFE